MDVPRSIDDTELGATATSPAAAIALGAKDNVEVHEQSSTTEAHKSGRMIHKGATGALQDIQFADDIDDEIAHFKPDSGYQQRLLPSSSVTETDTSPPVPRPQRRASRRSDDRIVTTSESTSPTNSSVKNSPSLYVGVVSAVFVAIAAIAISIVALIQVQDDEEDARPLAGAVESLDCLDSNDGSTCELEKEPSLLDSIFARGYINCGLSFEQVGFLVQTGVDSETQEPTYAGFDVDLCRALASAIFDGDSEAYRPIVFALEDRWTMLNSTNIDVLFRPTRTMQRQIYEPSIDTGMEFSVPYFYDGLGFGGAEELFVDCAENGIVNGTCADLRICVLSPGTHEAVVEGIVPRANIVVLTSESDYYESFPSVCNVLAGEQSMIAEATLRQWRYEGSYTVGTGVYSREPLCMATRRGDPVWTNFVEAVLNSLYQGEEVGTTRVTAANMATTDLFGPRFERMFQNAVAAGGNYGELYVNNLEAFVPRAGLNRLNGGRSSRIWSFPYGNLDVQGPDLHKVSPTIKAIRERGYVNCGHAPTIFFLSSFEEERNTYSGAAIDLCRVISAALFYGMDRTLFTTMPFPLRATLLDEGEADVVITMSRSLEDDVREPAIGRGLSLSSAYFMLGTAFGGLPQFVDCGERLDVFSIECQSLRVCTLAGSEIVTLFSDLLREAFLVQKDSDDEQFEALETGECNTILTAVLQQQARFSQLGADSPFVVGTRFFSIVSISMATREDDPVWSAFVDWILMSLVYAEENDINKATATLMPRTNLFGRLGSEALYHAVNIVGNYGEFYSRNFERFLSRAGVHLLNDNTQPRQFSF